MVNSLEVLGDEIEVSKSFLTSYTIIDGGRFEVIGDATKSRVFDGTKVSREAEENRKIE